MKPTLILICLGATASIVGEDRAPVVPQNFPWKLGTTARFSWMQEDRKVGDILMVFDRVEDPSGPLYRMRSRRQRLEEGADLRARGDLYFRPDGSPVRYTEDLQFQAVRGKGQQEVEIRFEARKIHLSTISNGKRESAARHAVDNKPGTRLFATGALEHWALFASQLAGKEDATTIPVFYPELAKVLEIEFVPQAAAEQLEVAGKKIETRRFRFQYKEYPDKGEIWIDAAGRLVQYASGPVRLLLEG